MTNGAERLFVPIGSSEPVAETRPVPVASFTKLWVAVAVLALVREGKLTLDVTIRETLPELSARPWADSTVRELLTHTSRVPEFDEKGGFYGRADVDFSKPVDMLVMHLSREATEKRGVFRYRNAEFALLGAILAVREGKPAGAVLAQRVFEPAHMTRSGLLVGQPPPDLDLTPLGRVRSRNFFTAGAGYASPRDLIAFFEALAGDTLLDAPSRALLFAGSTARDGGAFGCWAYPYDVADAGTSLLVERPGGLGNVRLVSTFLPRTGRAVVAFSSEPIDLGRPRTRGIARSFARLAFE